MARAGLYKSQVKKARDMLLAQGKHPSVDAIRIVLGNTGSKTTIHKYLKELEEDEGVVQGRQINLSEEIQGLVLHLAAQLQDEAEATIGRLLADSTEKEQQNAQTLATANQEIERLAKDLQYCKQALDEEKKALLDEIGNNQKGLRNDIQALRSQRKDIKYILSLESDIERFKAFIDFNKLNKEFEVFKRVKMDSKNLDR